MRNTEAQFITTGPIELIKNLKKLAWSSSTIKTPETPNDPGPKQGFKTTLPPDWEKRKTMTRQEKTEYFNNWASKLQL